MDCFIAMVFHDLFPRPRYPEYTLGCGLFQFIVSMIPPAFIWLVEALGFKGDRARGVRLIREVLSFSTLPSSLNYVIWRFRRRYTRTTIR